MTLVPIGNNVVIKRAKALTIEKGIYLPDSSQKQTNEGKVLAVGDGLLMADGTRSPMLVNDGDRVLFDPYQGYTVKLDGEDYLIMSAHNIIAIIE